MVGSTRMQKSLHDGNRSFKLFLPAMPPTSPSPFLKFITTHQWKLAAALLVLYYLSAVTATLQKSATFDELTHLTQGYLLWTHDDVPHIPNNGVFAQRLAAIPLVLNGVNFPELKNKSLKSSDVYWMERFFFYNSNNDVTRMLLMARSMTTLLGVATGLVIFLWSRTLFGVRGGLISLILFTFCPNMLGNAALVTADMAATLGFVLATYTFWNATHRMTYWTLSCSALGLGILVLAKLSCILIAPIFIIIVLIRLWAPTGIEFQWNRNWKAGVLFQKITFLTFLILILSLFVLVVLWLFYNFTYLSMGGTAARETVLGSADFTIFSAQGLKFWVTDTLYKSGLIPPAFIDGLCGALLTMDHSPSFLCGRYSMDGWWWFFCYTFFAKTPLCTLLLFLSAGGAILLKITPQNILQSPQQNDDKTGALYRLLPLFILGGVYLLASLTTHTNIGHRHILPLYPPLFILAGANEYWIRKGKWFIFYIVLMLSVTITSSWFIRPHYLAFFSKLGGGPQQGYRHLVDSSLDWGQDLPGLKKWLDAHVEPGKEKIYLSYFGTALPEHYGILAEPLPCHFDWTPRKQFPLEAGVYCLSATMLESVYSPLIGPWCVPYENLYQRAVSETQRWEQTAGNADARRRLVTEQGAAYWEQVLEAYRQARFSRLCAYLRQREPDAEVGYSILIYRLTTEDLKKALGPGPAELLPSRVPLYRNAPLPH